MYWLCKWKHHKHQEIININVKKYIFSSKYERQIKLFHWLLEGGQIIVQYFDPPGQVGLDFGSVKIKTLWLLKKSLI